MDPQAYAIEAAIEAEHWWFEGRRRLFCRIIRDIGATPDWAVLDVGTSTGTNLRMLRDMGFERVTGVDNSESAIEFCRSKGFGPVRLGDAQDLPFDTESFDLVLATDIIEHVPDDARAMDELARLLKPGGTALITVPAFMALWGHNDDTAHHRRRYRLRDVTVLARTAGLEIRRDFYFNFLLFVPIWLVRTAMRLVTRDGGPPENEINSPVVNEILKRIFALDVRLAPALRPPFGVSALVLATKPGG